jgi:hypothetical protein
MIHDLFQKAEGLRFEELLRRRRLSMEDHMDHQKRWLWHESRHSRCEA